MTDASKAVVESSEYEPYGQLTNRALTDGPGFTGHVQDAATGLTYMQQRYYDPLTGRMLSADPVTVLSGSIWHFNRYAYAYNNPYSFRDRDGRCPVCGLVGDVVGGIGGGFVGLVTSGGDWRAGVAGAVGGAVGGAITGATLGAGSGAASIAVAGITAGIMGELASETTDNALNHGSNVRAYKYSPGKIAVSGGLGAMGAFTGQIVDDLAKPAYNAFVRGLVNESITYLPLSFLTC